MLRYLSTLSLLRLLLLPLRLLLLPPSLVFDPTSCLALSPRAASALASPRPSFGSHRDKTDRRYVFLLLRRRPRPRLPLPHPRLLLLPLRLPLPRWRRKSASSHAHEASNQDSDPDAYGRANPNADLGADGGPGVLGTPSANADFLENMHAGLSRVPIARFRLGRQTAAVLAAAAASRPLSSLVVARNGGGEEGRDAGTGEKGSADSHMEKIRPPSLDSRAGKDLVCIPGTCFLCRVIPRQGCSSFFVF